GGGSLTRARPVLLPGERVFVPFRSPRPADVTDYPTLSGYAAGPTLEEAALHALLEVVERDAFMIAWANRLRLRPLELSPTARDGLGDVVAAWQRPGLEVRCGLVELDLGAPAAIAMARSRRPGDPFTT